MSYLKNTKTDRQPDRQTKNKNKNKNKAPPPAHARLSAPDALPRLHREEVFLPGDLDAAARLDRPAMQQLRVAARTHGVHLDAAGCFRMRLR